MDMLYSGHIKAENFLLPNRMDKFVDLRMLCFTSCLDHFWQNLFSTWQFIVFQLLNSSFSLTVMRLRY